MNYAFPLPKCQTHTYEWENGPHDTCYRCGADRPDKQEDRDALAKEHATASNTETPIKETDMHNTTDTRIRDVRNNRDELSRVPLTNASGNVEPPLPTTDAE